MNFENDRISSVQIEAADLAVAITLPCPTFVAVHSGETKYFQEPRKPSNPSELLPLVHEGIVEAMPCACYEPSQRLVQLRI